MITTTRYLLLAASLLCLLYPLWGMLSPESYLAELNEVVSINHEISNDKVSVAAAFIWIENSLLAIIFFSLAAFLKDADSKWFTISGFGLFLYPFCTAAVNVLIVYYLKSQSGSVSATIEFTSVHMSSMLFGLVFLALSKQQINNQQPA